VRWSTSDVLPRAAACKKVGAIYKKVGKQNKLFREHYDALWSGCAALQHALQRDDFVDARIISV
jgi:hypothetical protein